MDDLGQAHAQHQANDAAQGRQRHGLAQEGLAQLIHLAVPALPVHTPVSFVLLAEGIAIAIGLAAGVLPARSAARLDPVEALRAE